MTEEEKEGIRMKPLSDYIPPQILQENLSQDYCELMLSSKSFLTPRDRKFLPIPLVTVLFVGLLVKVIKYFGFNMDF